jgi:hypothetical protein
MNARIPLAGAIAGAILATAWIVSTVVRRAALGNAVPHHALETWEGEGGASAPGYSPPSSRS